MYFISLAALSLATGLVLGSEISQKAVKPQGMGSPPRIVGGYEVKPEFKYSWMVAIHYSGDHYCGGSLYTDDTVITAAHCSELDISVYTVKVHRHNQTKTDGEEGGKTFKVKSIKSHPDYDGLENFNDISIWKLDRPYPNKKPKFDLDTESLSGKIGTLTKIVGWGNTKSGGIGSPVLLEVKVPVYNVTKCIKDYEKKKFVVDPTTQFCAAFPEGGKDSCQGDSGGPLFIENYNRMTLLGIVSWGYGCALPGYPGVYTKVNNYIKWIKDNL